LLKIRYNYCKIIFSYIKMKKSFFSVKATGVRMRLLFIIAILLLTEIPTVNGQYFGRNRPGYRTFDFQVYESPNFTIYHYFENDSVIHALANRFEHWYIRHRELFKDTFQVPSPILIYQNHPDFQQTTAVSGNISIGTQGVTEALKNRVVIPVLETNAQTDHVIGHELVHVFHFRALFIDDSLSLNSLRNLPLWLVEGMAEYFSIGSIDAHTAMIIRDAVLQDDFPTLNEMTRNYQYNPYRYGHSFVAFLGRTWGDDVIAPLYRETAKFGYERALERVIGLNASTVSDLWKSATVNHFQRYVEDTLMHIPIGSKVLDETTAGNLNISPSLSPNGEHVAFFSERDLFSLDLFLANARTGRIIRKLSSTTRSTDIDAFNFFESVGSWSPDGNRFVHVAVIRGRNQLVIVDANRPRRTRYVSVEGVPSLNNPAWSPDGQSIVFSGVVEGVGNLFQLNLETNEVTNLTNDRFSYIHPSWSPDGRYLAFATDRLPASYNNPDSLNYTFYVGLMDMQSPDREVTVFDIFPSSINVNPVFNAEGTGLYFLSNNDGFRNLFHYNIEEDRVFKLTNYFTGISGITHLSPAISVARNTGEIAYSYFQKGNYSVFNANPGDFNFVEVDRYHIDMTAATLAPLNRATRPVVDNFLTENTITPVFPIDSFQVKPFRPQFGLTYIGSSGVGAATSRFGTGMAGGVSMMFSDIVGDHQLFSLLAVNGEVYDFGGQVGYVNQKRRINWGGSASHIPYPFAMLGIGQDTIGGNPVIDYQFIIHRTFETQFGMFAYYPISTTRRLEMGASHAWYYFRQDIFHTYYNQFGFFIGQDRRKGESADGFNLQRISLGYIGDNSYFGMASPMNGHRYRFSVEKLFGRIDMFNVVADYRQYYFRQPFSVAFRMSHFGRYGKNAQNNLFYPLFLGYPGYMRGFDYNALSGMVSSDFNPQALFTKIQGSRMMLGGLELKVPFTGPKRLALIPSNFLFTELNWFLDAGLAWHGGNEIGLEIGGMNDPNYRFPVFSTGPSIRINLFGALILEPYYAIPFAKGQRWPGVWGLSFWPGW
jgi:hypothetical protein